MAQSAEFGEVCFGCLGSSNNSAFGFTFEVIGLRCRAVFGFRHDRMIAGADAESNYQSLGAGNGVELQRVVVCGEVDPAHQKIAPKTSRPRAAMHRVASKPTPQNSATTLNGLTSARASLALAFKTLSVVPSSPRGQSDNEFVSAICRAGRETAASELGAGGGHVLNDRGARAPSIPGRKNSPRDDREAR